MTDSDLGDEQLAAARGLNAAQVQRIRSGRGLTPQGLQALPDERLRRAVRRLDLPDMPRAREAFRRLQQDTPGGIPPNALLNALTRLDSSRTRSLAPQSVAGVPTGHAVDPRALLPTLAGLPSDHRGWASLGPGNIGGRTRSIIVHPTSRGVMWLGSVAGGVWRTEDGGQSWQPVDDFMANLAVSCMVMDPTNARIVYAGTGEGFYNLDSLRGAGIFRTIDGATWSQMPSTATPEFQNINRLAISRDGKVLLAATRSGIFRSADPQRVTWTHVVGGEIADVKFHPSNSNLAVAGGLRDGQAYYSADGGQTWIVATHASPWEGRVELAYALRQPTTVYASVQMRTGEIWRSTTGGRSYLRRGTRDVNGQPAEYLGEQGWYGNTIWAGDPANANLIITGGVDLWRSTDGGNTLVDVSTWWDPSSVHADHHCIVSDPGYNGRTNRRIFVGNDGGIFTTDDARTAGNNPNLPRNNGWKELVNTYGVTQFYAGAGNPTSGVIIGGAQDNGTLRYSPQSGTEGWTTMYGGDGGWCAADPTDPNYFYGEYVFLEVCRSADAGLSAEPINGHVWDGVNGQWVWKPIPYRIPDSMNGQALFIAPFTLDPNQSDRMLAGGMSLWRSNDVKAPNTPTTGPVWQAIKPGVGAEISAISVARGKSDVIWIGHLDGQVYKTTNGTTATPVWQKIDRVGPKPLVADRYCTEICIDPRKSDVVYVTFSGYSTGNVWRTTDGGKTWSNIGGALPEAPIRALRVHPRKSNFLYLGTEVGVFASEDTGATWSPTNEGPTNCSVDDLFWMNEVLICVTHGRGMFSIDLSRV